MSLIRFDSVSKIYRRHTGQRLIRQHVWDWFRRDRSNEFFALREVSFEVKEGESVAVIGKNGAGKSTLLTLVAGLAPPDSGRVEVNGKVAALLELGAGFHPDLTGRENLELNAALLGYSTQTLKARAEEIIDFSGIREFIDEPLRTYSSGMTMRLGFSVAIHSDPSILIVDEVLGVGDQEFQDKCMDRILSLRRQGKTLLCVSHSTETVMRLCDRAIWLDHGRMVCDGKASDVLHHYVHEIPLPL